MSNVDKNAEIILVNPTASGGTINLPLTTTLPYRTLTIKHIGSTSLNGITLSAQGSDSFEDGTTSYVITRITTFVTFYANAAANRWVLVGGTNTFTQTISSLTVNTINGQTYLPISPANLVSTSFLETTLQSTISGLATSGYISSSQLVSTTIGLVDHLELQSTFAGLGTVGYISSSQLASSLQSTVRGLGTIGYISSITAATTPAFLSTNAFFTSSLVASTISTTNTLFANGIVAASTTTRALFTSSLLVSTISTTNTLFTNILVARSTNLSSVYISSLTGVTGYISSLTTDSLTIGDGNGWVDFGAARAVIFSSIQENTGSLYATTAFIGNTSTLNQLRYWGLFGNYNNTILAEVSTGSAIGAQEFLVFKGSSASDRIRMQTTGDIRFEPQVAAREFSTATALATPTMILQSNLVGIATATPVTTLDVRGTAFATILSTQQFFLSSINGTVFSPVSPNNLVSTSFLNTTLQSTVANLGQIYLSTVTATSFSNLVSTPFLNTTLQSTTGQLQSNIEAWSQYQATNDILLSNGTGIRMVDPNASIQLKTNLLSIVDINGGYGTISMGESISFLTSSSSESYGIGFSSNVTGTISSFAMTRGDNITFTTGSFYISSLYFGNLGGTTAGQLTTDATATDLFWKGSKLNDQSGGGGGITTANLASTVAGLGTVNYISGPEVIANVVFASQITGGSILTASTLYVANDLLATEFPVWNSSNQISGSDPEPAPLAVDVFGSARILKNLYVGSTTTVLTTAGVQTQQISSLNTNASTITLSGKGPLFASTNTVTNFTDVFLNHDYVAQKAPQRGVVFSTIFENMSLQPEFLGLHFILSLSLIHI